MLAGLLAPTSGHIFFGGTDICALGDKERARLRRTKIGYVPQGSAALQNLSVFDNVRLPRFLAGQGAGADGRASFLLEKVGLGALADMLPTQLSGGELRRVYIARAMMNEPELLIADEPTADLDAETSQEIMGVFSGLHRSGTAILMVTHELDTLRFGDKVLRMANGTLAD
jgi:putative ABC transport system ATP-binding protein